MCNGKNSVFYVFSAMGGGGPLLLEVGYLAGRFLQIGAYIISNTILASIRYPNRNWDDYVASLSCATCSRCEGRPSRKGYQP